MTMTTDSNHGPSPPASSLPSNIDQENIDRNDEKVTSVHCTQSSAGPMYANRHELHGRPPLATIEQLPNPTGIMNLGTPNYALTPASPETPIYDEPSNLVDFDRSPQPTAETHVIPSDDANPLYENLQSGNSQAKSMSISTGRSEMLTSNASFGRRSASPSPSKRARTPTELAVELRNVNTFYGKGVNRYHALRDVTLRVPLGGIYGLLGPSGCGKTSLLRIIVGRKRACSGSIRVFGCAPGQADSLIPGPGVGFMPQELSLFPDFTITETLVYFASVYRMPAERVPDRIRFLLRFLDLESRANRLVKRLSGGQQRRVSLAAALVHSPPLVILDEPTVGVDPLLRHSIWEHLVHLTQETRLTVLITTHYVEEANRAQMIGMMRFGRLLVEARPTSLLRKFNKSSLEDAFLHLCLVDEKEFGALDEWSDESDDDEDDQAKSYEPKTSQDKYAELHGGLVKAMLPLSNNPISPATQPLLIQSPTNPYTTPTKPSAQQSYVKSNDFLPMITLTDTEQNSTAISLLSRPAGTDSGRSSPIEGRSRSSSTSAGGLSSDSALRNTRCEPLQPELARRFGCQPLSTSKTQNYARKVRDSSSRVNALVHKNLTRLRRNLPVLLFQFLLPSIEVILFSICIGADPFDIPVAVYNQDRTGQFSSWYLRTIDNHTVRQLPYTSLPNALDAVRNGDAWAAIAIKQNFSDALSERHMMGLSADNGTIDQSNIYIFIDMTNQLIGYKLQRTFLEAFQSFSKNVLIETGQNPAVVELPVKIGKPIYGDRQPTFTEFMAPGVVLTIAFLAAVALTALAIVLERKEGLLERSLVAGVTSFEFLISHIITQLLVILVQVSLLLIFTFLVFDVPSRGPFIWVILLTFLQATCGMSYGLLISTLCESETAATMLALGSFYPNLLLSGTVWPIQAMPELMRSFALVLPQTIPIESMRYIISRGWDLSYPQVAAGFAVTIVWIAVFQIAALLVFRRIQ